MRTAPAQEWQEHAPLNGLNHDWATSSSLFFDQYAHLMPPHADGAHPRHPPPHRDAGEDDSRGRVAL